MTSAATTTLIAGIPRSGTNLACTLLNEFPDTVALAEPMLFEPHGDRGRTLAEIDQFIATCREQALRSNEAVSRNVVGVIPDNWYDPPTMERRRARARVQSPISLNKPLTRDFYLIVKHPTEFSALADELIGRYPIVAMVRHPLAVLASWQTVDLPISRGRMPNAEMFHPGLAATLDATPDCLRRQIILIDWLLHIFADLPQGSVLRYEDMIAKPEQSLARFTPHATRPARELTVCDPFGRYPGIDLAVLARELLAVRHSAALFYPDFEESLEPSLRRS